MSKSQLWELRFTLPYHKLDSAKEFNVFGCKLSLSRIDTYHSEGRLLFGIQNDLIDKEKARTFGKDWIQRNLVDSYLIAFGRYLKPEFETLNLLNESELTLVPRTAYEDRGFSVAPVLIPLPISNVEKSFDLLMKTTMNVNKELLERSVGWFRKSIEPLDIVDRFVMQWIAFNVLYGMFNPDKKSDQIAIKNLFNKHPSREQIGEILVAFDGTIKKLGSMKLKDWHEQKNYSDELRNLIGDQDVRRVLMAVGLCLWVVRSELFHGGTMPSEEVNFIRECSQLLERIYRECYCHYVGQT